MAAGEFMDVVYETLIADQAWLALARGLSVTLDITVWALLLGLVIGGLVCALRMSRYAVLRWLATLYCAVLRGSPVLLLLMLMYYVIFAESELSAPFIAVVAFGLNVSAHLAEIMRSALMATDKRQVEAARMLGFSALGAFCLITLPQAMRVAKPLCQSAIVNLVQWTSVVGYVSITDLTTVINNMTSRTMQPLLMILVGIALYLGVAYLCYGLFWLADQLFVLSSRREQVNGNRV